MCEGMLNDPITMTAGVPEDVQNLRGNFLDMLLSKQGATATPFTGNLSAPPNPLQTQAAGLMGRLMGSGASQPWEPRPPVGPPPGGDLPPGEDWGGGIGGGTVDNPIDYPEHRGMFPGDRPGLPGSRSGGDNPKPPYVIGEPPIGGVAGQAYNPAGMAASGGANPLLGMIMGMRNRQQSAYNPRGY